jgi:hypothetical protein
MLQINKKNAEAILGMAETCNSEGLLSDDAIFVINLIVSEWPELKKQYRWLPYYPDVNSEAD